MAGPSEPDRKQLVVKTATLVERRGAAARGRARKASPARRYDPEGTRSRILEAAYQLFATHGYSMTGTADIAAAAGVSEGSIFYHFGSKHSLLVELGRMHGQKLVAAMQGDDRPETLTLGVSLNRCFDFFDASHRRSEDDGDCNGRRPAPEAEPFFEAAKEIIVGWAKLHLDSKRAAAGDDNLLVAQLIFAVVGEAMQQYFAPGRTDPERQHIRAECVRFCSAAVGEA